MKLLYCMFVLSVVFSTIPTDKGVLILNDSNFEEAIKQYNILLVEFYTPWSGHSQKFESEYNEAAKILGEKDEPLHLAKVNVIESPRFNKEYSLRHFPTLKFFRNGIVSDYDYPLKKDNIVSFMEQMSESPSTAIFSTSELQRMIKDGNALVGYFESTDSQEFKDWITSLSSMSGVNAYHVISSEVAEEMKVEIPSIHFYHDASKVSEFTGKILELERWLTIYSLPLVIPFSQIYAEKLFSKKHGIQTHLICVVSRDMLTEVNPVLEKIALLYREKLFVVYLPMENSRLVSYLGVTGKSPTLLVMNIETKQKYLMEGSLTEKHVKDFVVDYFKGELKPYYKSMDIPTQQEDSLHMLVGKTFNQVYADDKNAFVLLTSLFHRKSEELLKAFTELSTVYKDQQDVLIAMMDVTVNEVEDFPIRSFPSIMFFKAGEGKRGVYYEGEKTAAAMQSFIESNRVAVDESEL